MKIYWLGHSCFYLRGEGVSVLTDPFDEEVGYDLPHVQADIVLVSHDHHDHNNVKAVRGHPKIIRGSGRHSALWLDFLGIETYHDTKRGLLRGPNTIFCFSLDGVRVCHLGDLGHVLQEREVRTIGSVDILFVPVGGVYTLDGEEANVVIGQIQPRMVIPMHYHTSSLSFDLDPVEKFLQGRDFCGPKKCLETKEMGLLDECRIMLLDYMPAENVDR